MPVSAGIRRRRAGIRLPPLPERLSILLAHDGKRAEDVRRIVAVDAIEVKEERIEPCNAMATIFLIPNKRRSAIAEIAGEWLQIPRRIGQPQHLSAHEIANLDLAQSLHELLRTNERQLFNNDNNSKLKL